MKIKSEDFWKNIGEIIHVPNDIKWSGDDETINLPRGTYQIVEVREFGTLFLEISKNTLVDAEPIDNMVFDSIITPPKERLELLEDALTKQILLLSAEGWTEMENAGRLDLDLTPIMNKLKTVQVMRQTLDIK